MTDIADHLDYHVAVEPLVVGGAHDAHPTLAKLFGNPVVADQLEGHGHVGTTRRTTRSMVKP